ncbi:MAG TPA: hypothetical protein IGS53_11095 [Leptolyngbyaceae cyanobacterium M33_DOE_097]|nr:hypothetical protein [Leptolyngbyaceae cyanobacterium M33_DOE_097]
MPEQEGDLSELKQLLNLSEDAWVLTASWLLFSLYPKYPHPILILHGEQGTGKSYAARVLKSLIDPTKAPLIPNVANLRDLAIAAENRWVLAYDNLSGLSAEQSDALCRISTGGGFSTRTLYENDQETVFEFIRPQILTGIDSLATRGDLLERALLVNLLAIAEERRLSEVELNEKLGRLGGRILGAMLTALSQTLKALPQTKPDRLPRMADFARFAIAAETAIGLSQGTFLDVYRRNRQEAHGTALEASPIAVAIQKLMASGKTWTGTATQLLENLNELVDEKTINSKSWVSNGRSLGKVLIRLAPNLRSIGIVVTQKRTSQCRTYRIELTEKQTSQTSQTSQLNQETDFDDAFESANVTDVAENVTDDKHKASTWQMSSVDKKSVTTEQLIQQGFQQLSDKHDIDDMKNTTSSRWVGKQVKKQGKAGWVGSVQSVQDNIAEVLWTGDRYPTSVNVSELEEIA